MSGSMPANGAPAFRSHCLSMTHRAERVGISIASVASRIRWPRTQTTRHLHGSAGRPRRASTHASITEGLD